MSKELTLAQPSTSQIYWCAGFVHEAACHIFHGECFTEQVLEKLSCRIKYKLIFCQEMPPLWPGLMYPSLSPLLPHWISLIWTCHLLSFLCAFASVVFSAWNAPPFSPGWLLIIFKTSSNIPSSLLSLLLRFFFPTSQWDAFPPLLLP